MILAALSILSPEPCIRGDAQTDWAVDSFDCTKFAGRFGSVYFQELSQVRGTLADERRQVKSWFPGGNALVQAINRLRISVIFVWIYQLTP